MMPDKGLLWHASDVTKFWLLPAYNPFSLPGCLNLGLIVALYPLNFRQSCRPVQPCGVTISGCHFFNGLRSAVIAAVLPSLHPENFHYKPLATGSAEQGLTQPPHGKRGQIRVGIIVSVQQEPY